MAKEFSLNLNELVELVTRPGAHISDSSSVKTQQSRNVKREKSARLQDNHRFGERRLWKAVPIRGKKRPAKVPDWNRYVMTVLFVRYMLCDQDDRPVSFWIERMRKIELAASESGITDDVPQSRTLWTQSRWPKTKHHAVKSAKSMVRAVHRKIVELPPSIDRRRRVAQLARKEGLIVTDKTGRKL